MSQTITRESPALIQQGRRPSPVLNLAQVLKPIYRFIFITGGVLLGFVLLWEGYKALGQLTGDRIPFTDILLPVSTSDAAMPHVSTILGALFSPASGTSGATLLSYLLLELSVTLRESAIGVGIAVVIGCLLAVILREVKIIERGVLPWLVISQTIPLVALAPIIVVWMGSAGLPSWVAVSVIAAYLSFFPIVINMITGLNSPDPVQVELMRSVSASRLQVLWWMRFPAAMPYLFTGLRLAAIAAVVGAIVGELAAGTGRGIGRAILSAAYYFTNAPENLFAAVLVASFGGIVFVQIVALLEFIVLKKRNTNG